MQFQAAARARNHGALNDVLQLSDIAGPVMADQLIQNVVRNAVDRLALLIGELLSEMLN
jgi:hypothetical protein